MLVLQDEHFAFEWMLGPRKRARHAIDSAPSSANLSSEVRTMDKNFKQMTDFLVGMGIDEVAHTHKSYLAHLIAVYRDLESLGCPEDVCRAGMFHSIYGTEKFQGFTLPLERRGEVCALIGDRAERLAYLNCAMDRASFDRALDGAAETYPIVDRITGREISLSGPDFDDLCRVHLIDWLEQVPRSCEWDYRRAGYQRMAQRLGVTAEERFQKVFGQEEHHG
jgi:hypothetical protein